MSHLGDRITALVDQKLDPASREQVLCHLVACAECRAEVDLERGVRRALSLLGYDQTPPPSLEARLLAVGEPGDVWPAPPGRRSPLAPSPFAWPAAESVLPVTRTPYRAAPQRSRKRFVFAGSLSLGAATAAMAFVVGGQPAGPALSPPVDSYRVEHAAVTGTVPLTDPVSGAVAVSKVPVRP